MKGIIGKNIGMTSLFDEQGRNIPCSVIEAGPCSIVQIKTLEKDGYSSIQLGFEDKNKKNISKSVQGHFKKANVSTKKKIAEFYVKKCDQLRLGEKITVNSFNEGEFVEVTGFSKGRGFQGVVKRHGFSGVGERTHGQHNKLRAPGSIGAGSDPSRVFKGVRMSGKMGNRRVTVKNLRILKIDLEKNLLIVKGSVPGTKYSYLIIKKYGG
jgi:large subunit ribosomal protein L3